VGNAIITFIAVLVGAAASVAGSIIVNRRERRCCRQGCVEIVWHECVGIVWQRLMCMRGGRRRSADRVDAGRRWWVAGRAVVVSRG